MLLDRWCENCKFWEEERDYRCGQCGSEDFHSFCRAEITKGDCCAHVEVDSDFGCRFWERRG